MPEKRGTLVIAPALREKLKRVPLSPGVYIMHDAIGTIIYVGKAKVLRHRVRQYFQSPERHTPKVWAMVAQIADFEWIVTASAVEALILEANLIKEHAPHYNIRLKDDKAYPFIKVSSEEAYPRVFMTRRKKRDGGRYFGPFTDAGAVRETLGFLKRIFPVRSCHKPMEVGGDPSRRPCLNHHIGRCLAPCAGLVSAEQYRQVIDQVILFLEGRRANLLPELERRMQAASAELAFEQAARLRDNIVALKKILERQKIVSDLYDECDAVVVALGQVAVAQVFQVRGGMLVGREHFILEQTGDQAPVEALGAFLQQYYLEASYVPPEIWVPEALAEPDELEAYLAERRGGVVHVRVPQRGDKAKLVAMATENAHLAQAEELARVEAQFARDEGAALVLGEALGLASPPRRIECYDISNTQGSESVGSMVVFEEGQAKKSDYRRFRIKTVEGANDFASLQEVIRRRFSHARRETEAEAKRFARRPDLLIIDGGKGQLAAVREEMRRLGVEDIPAVGLAKQEELLFLEGQSEPVALPHDSAPLHLVQRIRDEAHRFAVSYHREVRDRRTRHSRLDEIPGVGPTRKKALLHAFGSLAGVRQASEAELAGVPGIGQELAALIRDNLRSEG